VIAMRTLSWSQEEVDTREPDGGSKRLLEIDWIPLLEIDLCLMITSDWILEILWTLFEVG
jgi:hypothetical protein